MINSKIMNWQPTTIEEAEMVNEMHLKMNGIEYDSDGASLVSRALATREVAKKVLKLDVLEINVTLDHFPLNIEKMQDTTHVLINGQVYHVAQIKNKELSNDIYKWLGGVLSSDYFNSKNYISM